MAVKHLMKYKQLLMGEKQRKAKDQEKKNWLLACSFSLFRVYYVSINFSQPVWFLFPGKLLVLNFETPNWNEKYFQKVIWK